MSTRSEIRSIFYEENSKTKTKAHPALAAPATNKPSFATAAPLLQSCLHLQETLSEDVNFFHPRTRIHVDYGPNTVQSLLLPDQRRSSTRWKISRSRSRHYLCMTRWPRLKGAATQSGRHAYQTSHFISTKQQSYYSSTIHGISKASTIKLCRKQWPGSDLDWWTHVMLLSDTLLQFLLVSTSNSDWSDLG